MDHKTVYFGKTLNNSLLLKDGEALLPPLSFSMQRFVCGISVFLVMLAAHCQNALLLKLLFSPRIQTVTLTLNERERTCRTLCIIVWIITVNHSRVGKSLNPQKA